MASPSLYYPSEPDPVASENAGQLFVGMIFACALHGVLYCQALWYFRSFKTDRRLVTSAVAGLFLLVNVNFVLMVYMLHYYLVGRGIGIRDWEKFRYCAHWTFFGIIISTEMCCLLVEGFFILRLWSLIQQKKLIALMLIPFCSGWVLSIVFTVMSIQFPCYPDLLAITPWILACYGCRTLTDGIITTSMSFILYRRARRVTRMSNMLTIVRRLIFLSIATGFFMWLITLAFIITYVASPKTMVSTGIYFVRGGVYTNAMLATLNQRSCFRAIGTETVPLEYFVHFSDPPRQDEPVVEIDGQSK